MEQKFINTGLNLEAVNDTGLIEGYASVFDVVDNARDIVVKGAFKDSLARHRKKNRLPPMLWQHDAKEPIGVWHEMFEDATGLYVRGQLFVDDIPRARQAHRLLTEGGLTGLSIGFKTVESEMDARTGVRRLIKIDLMEVSMVTFPAQDLARAAAIKAELAHGQLPGVRDFEAFLRDAGFSRKQAKSLIAGGWRTLAPDTVLMRDDDAEILSALEGVTSGLLDTLT